MGRQPGNAVALVGWGLGIKWVKGTWSWPLISGISQTHQVNYYEHIYQWLQQIGPVIFRDRGKVAEFAELPT